MSDETTPLSKRQKKIGHCQTHCKETVQSVAKSNILTHQVSLSQILLSFNCIEIMKMFPLLCSAVKQCLSNAKMRSFICTHIIAREFGQLMQVSELVKTNVHDSQMNIMQTIKSLYTAFDNILPSQAFLQDLLIETPEVTNFAIQYYINKIVKQHIETQKNGQSQHSYLSEILPVLHEAVRKRIVLVFDCVPQCTDKIIRDKHDCPVLLLHWISLKDLKLHFSHPNNHRALQYFKLRLFFIKIKQIMHMIMDCYLINFEQNYATVFQTLSMPYPFHCAPWKTLRMIRTFVHQFDWHSTSRSIIGPQSPSITFDPTMSMKFEYECIQQLMECVLKQAHHFRNEQVLSLAQTNMITHNYAMMERTAWKFSQHFDHLKQPTIQRLKVAVLVNKVKNCIKDAALEMSEASGLNATLYTKGYLFE